MPIKALIFDFDGTILDTETPEFQSWQAVYDSFGCELPLAQWINTIGRGHDQITFDPYAYLQSSTGKIIDRSEVRAQWRQKFTELIAREPLRAGVQEYLREARELGLRLAIASSSKRAWIDEHMSRFDLHHFFEVIRSADNVSRTKPDPELFVSAAEALNLAPSEVIAIEDSPNGAHAARSAGMFCIVVPNPMTIHLTFETPDLIVPSLESVPLAKLLSEAGTRAG